MLPLSSILLLAYCFLFPLLAFISTSEVENFAPPRNLKELQDSLNSLGIQAPVNALESPVLKAVTTFTLGQASCKSTCTLLEYLLPEVVFLSASTEYKQQQSSYWSNQQAETQPACRVLPRSAKEVAITYLVAATFNCKFAVKGGGHAAFGGASSIEDGMTIDLQNLMSISVNSEKTITQVGAGNRWINVYEYLTPRNLSVVGGRVSDIGVSGLTLGGCGISYFSGRYGWACDGIVLANGQIRNANVNTNSDLYWALRGGGNNFGIVTRLDLETFPQGDMLGGVSLYPATANVSLFKAYQNFVTEQPQDPDAALILAFFYSQSQWLSNNNYEYAKPIRNPPIFREFFAIPTMSSTGRIANLTDITAELTTYNPSGFRYTTATFKNDAEIQRQIFDIFIEEMNSVKDLPGALPALVMQPISESVITHFSENGGNALGLADAEGPLLLVNLAFMWSNATDDEKIYAATSKVIHRSVAAAKKLGVYNKYIYQNYAAKGQDVFAGYGEANRQRLIEISKKYDPKSVFQKLQPGYFKLGRF
ncbi:MAG: hypothetical protein LQ343_007377 [Gyalolechia ehrenbergii]|nr:MAG: hypothetical protein LQ343_007377 [Gyalolechia ehrenbergii]